MGGLEVFPRSQAGHFLPHLKKAKLRSNMSNYFCQNQSETVSLLKLYWFGSRTSRVIKRIYMTTFFFYDISNDYTEKPQGHR